MFPPYRNHLVAHTAKRLNNPTPKSQKLNSLKKPQAQETDEHAYSVITNAKFADRPRPSGNSFPLYLKISIPISTYQSQAQIQQTQAQQ